MCIGTLRGAVGIAMGVLQLAFRLKDDLCILSFFFHSALIDWIFLIDWSKSLSLYT